MHVYDGLERLTGNPLEPPQAHYSSVKTRALPPQSDADIDDDYLSLDYGRVPYRMSVAQNREVKSVIIMMCFFFCKSFLLFQITFFWVSDCFL